MALKIEHEKEHILAIKELMTRKIYELFFVKLKEIYYHNI